MVIITKIGTRRISLLPTGSEGRGVLGIGGIPDAILPLVKM